MSTYNYKCPECKKKLYFDSHCDIVEGEGHYLCTNDNCSAGWYERGTVKVEYSTGYVYLTG